MDDIRREEKIWSLEEEYARGARRVKHAKFALRRLEDKAVLDNDNFSPDDEARLRQAEDCLVRYERELSRIINSLNELGEYGYEIP